jgi:hypothetical protein
MNLENNDFRNRFIRSLEIARPQLITTRSYQISSTALILDTKRQVVSSPLFPFAIRLHGELQGYCFFSSTQKKIPFSQFELSQILKKYFYQFGEKIESQTQLLLGMTESKTPKYERLRHLLAPYEANREAFLLKQTLNVQKTNHDTLEVLVFMAIAPNQQPLLEV